MSNLPLSEITLRDEAALRAMQAFIIRGQQGNKNQIALWAYEYADAFLAQREKRREE